MKNEISNKKLTRKHLEGEYDNLVRNDFPDSDRIKFIAELGASDELDYHYELICDSWKSGRRLYLENSFDRHDVEGLISISEDC